MRWQRATEEPTGPAEKTRGERGDTLIEVLLAVVVLGIAGVALLTAFATAITASSQHRHLATLDASVRAASDQVISQVQQAENNVFGSCPTTFVPNWQLSGSFTVTSHSVWYWNGSNFASGNPCTNYGPQLWTMTIGSGTYSTSVSTVIYDPQAPLVSGGSTPSKLVFLQPQGTGTGTVNAEVTPQPIVAVEDTNGNIVYSDAVLGDADLGRGPSGLELLGRRKRGCHHIRWLQLQRHGVLHPDRH